MRPASVLLAVAIPLFAPGVCTGIDAGLSPERGVVLAGPEGRFLAEACFGATEGPVADVWTPTASDIRALERVLAGALDSALTAAGSDLAPARYLQLWFDSGERAVGAVRFNAGR